MVSSGYGNMMIPFQVIWFRSTLKFLNLPYQYVSGTGPPRATNAFGHFHDALLLYLPSQRSGRSRTDDGCTEFGIFRKIMVPLCKPAIVSLFIFHFMYQWNDLLYPLLLTTDDNMKTLPSGLATFMGTHVVEYGIIMAGACLSLLPILIAYFYCAEAVCTGNRNDRYEG